MTSNIGVLLQIGQLISLIGIGIFAVAQLRSTSTILGSKVTGLAVEIVDVKAELKKLSEVLVTLAVTSKRLDNVEEDVRDLKRGHGFVTKRSEGGINGEWP